MINGVTKIVMTKADVLDTFKELQVCTDYNIDGKNTRQMPLQMERTKPVPVYKSFPGWSTSSSAANLYSNLPDTMKEYINFINGYLGVNIHYISNGPGRDQIIEVKQFLRLIENKKKSTKNLAV